METYSHSSLGLFDQCPKAFEYKYLQNLAEEFSTIEQHMGRCVHAALSEAYASKGRGVPLSVDQLCASYASHWNAQELQDAKVIKRGTDREAYYVDGLAMIRSFGVRVYSKDQSESLMLEHRFQVPIGGDKDTHAYSGVIDRVAQDGAGHLSIIDFKTGKNVPEPLHDLQLQSYAIFVFQRYGAAEVELIYEDLRNGRSATALMGRQSVTLVMRKVAEKIEAIETASSFPARPSVLCDWCGFNQMCQSGRGTSSTFRSRSWRVVVEEEDLDETGDTCPRCGADLVEREGRRGPFIGCSNFPRCRYTRDDW